MGIRFYSIYIKVLPKGPETMHSADDILRVDLMICRGIRLKNKIDSLLFHKKNVGRLPGMIDVHCHLLPGLDDGAKNLDESLAMLRIAEEEGITDMIVTPHFSGEGSSDLPTLMRAIRKVQAEAEKNRISIRLYPGNEIYYFDGMETCLKEGKACTMNGSQYVLIEFAPFVPFHVLRNALDRIRANGYFPVLAHAERYECLLQNTDQVAYLKDMGVQIQVNSGSVTGKNGFSVKKFVHWTLQKRLADYIGTDAHSCGSRMPEMAKCRDIVIRKYGREYAFFLLRGNAEKFFMIDESE